MWIEFSELNFKLLIILIFPVSKTIEDYTKKIFLKEENPLFKPFRYFISYILCFVFILISHFKNKKLNNNNSNNQNQIGPLINPEESIDNSRNISLVTKTMTNQISELKQKMERKRKIKSGIFLIVLCGITLFCYLYKLQFEDENLEFAKQGIGIFFDIIFFIILSRLILKQKLYKHHWVSLGLISLILLIIFIITTLYMEKQSILHSFIYYCFYAFIFSFLDVLGKKYMNAFYTSPYFLLVVIGIIDAFGLLIFDIFAYFLNRDISGVIIGFQKNITSAGDFFGFLLDLVMNTIWNLGIWVSIYYYTPCHFFISEYISEYIYYLMNAVDSDKDFYSTSNIIIISFAYAINFFCCLIFNEVIILNFWNLDYNTKKRIEKRMENDNREPSIDEGTASSLDEGSLRRLSLNSEEEENNNEINVNN